MRTAIIANNVIAIRTGNKKMKEKFRVVQITTLPHNTRTLIPLYSCTHTANEEHAAVSNISEIHLEWLATMARHCRRYITSPSAFTCPMSTIKTNRFSNQRFSPSVLAIRISHNSSRYTLHNARWPVNCETKPMFRNIFERNFIQVTLIQWHHFQMTEMTVEHIELHVL